MPFIKAFFIAIVACCISAGAHAQQQEKPKWLEDFNYCIGLIPYTDMYDTLNLIADTYIEKDSSNYTEKIAFYVVKSVMLGEHSNLDSSILYLEKLLPYVLMTKTGEVIARTYWAIGRVYYLKSVYPTAIRYFLQHDYYAEKYHLRKEQMRANYYLSSCFKEMSNYPLSQYYIGRSALIALEIEDTFAVIKCFFALSTNCIGMEKYDSSLYFLNKTLPFIKKDDIENQAYYYSYLGNVYSGKNNPVLARGYQLKALKMFEEIQDGFGLEQVTENLGDTYIALHKLDSAFIFLKKAEQLNNEGNYGNPITLYEKLYVIYRKKGNTNMALDYLEEWVKQDSAVRKYDIDYIEQLKDSFVVEKNALVIEKEKQNIQALYRQKNRFTIYISIAAFGIFLLFSLLIYYRYKNRKEKEKNMITSQLNEIKMRAFQSQMNPHFVFNCLATIDSYILQNRKEEASMMMERFSRLIRIVLENSKQDWIELEKDLRALQLYLELEQIRAGHTFNFEISYDPKTLSHLFIPPLIIQPIVENAIVHGIRGVNNGVIQIKIRKDHHYLVAEVEDNGKGRKKYNLEHPETGKSSLGSSITLDRLKLMDAHKRSEYIEYTDLTNPTGTLVKIFIPYHPDTKDPA